MTLSPAAVTALTHPKPHRKGATEEQIFATNEKARKTEKLAAELGLIAPASLKKTPVQGK